MGVYLSSPITVKESEDQQNKKFAYGVSSMQGWRDTQEDAHSCILDFDEETALFGVFDGHGDAEIAIYTSEKLPEFIKNNEEYTTGDYENALISAFLTFDDSLASQPALARLYEIIKSKGKKKTDDRSSSSAGKCSSGIVQPGPSSSNECSSSTSHSKADKAEVNGSGSKKSIDLSAERARISVDKCGCTAVVALIEGNNLYVANAGDCRCVICKAGKAVDMSEDHKPINASEWARIKKAGGRVSRDGRVEGNLNLSRAIGDHQYKDNTKLSNKEQIITALPDVRVCKLEPDVEFIVLACDGIWNSMTSQEVVDFVKPKIQSNQKLSTICEELFDACLAPEAYICGDGAGCDNMTCIIVKIRQDSDNVEAAEEVDSKQTSASENIEVDSKKPVDSENVKAVPETGEADSKQENISDKAEVDSISADQLELAGSQNEKGNKNNEAVPSQSSEAEPVAEIEEKNDSSTRLKRCADSTKEGECQAKRQKTDTDVDSS